MWRRERNTRAGKGRSYKHRDPQHEDTLHFPDLSAQVVCVSDLTSGQVPPHLVPLPEARGVPIPRAREGAESSVITPRGTRRSQSSVQSQRNALCRENTLVHSCPPTVGTERRPARPRGALPADPCLPGSWPVLDRPSWGGFSPSQRLPNPNAQLLLENETWEPLVWSLGLFIRGQCPEVTSVSVCLCATGSGCLRRPLCSQGWNRGQTKAFRFLTEAFIIPYEFGFFLSLFVPGDAVLLADSPTPDSPPSPSVSAIYSQKPVLGDLTTANQCVLRGTWLQIFWVLESHKAHLTHLLFSWLWAHPEREEVFVTWV